MMCSSWNILCRLILRSHHNLPSVFSCPVCSGGAFTPHLLLLHQPASALVQPPRNGLLHEPSVVCFALVKPVDCNETATPVVCCCLVDLLLLFG
jgi:hypothetical protein